MKTAAALILSFFLCVLSARADVSLAWDASTDATVVGYNVYRGLSSGTLVKITSTPVTSPSYTDPDCGVGMTCFYAVTALNSTTESGFSNIVTATPTGLNLAFTSPDTSTLSVVLGSTVPLTVQASNATVVSIYINGSLYTTFRASAAASGGLTFNWKPTKKGSYTVKAVAQDSTNQKQAQVGITVR